MFRKYISAHLKKPDFIFLVNCLSPGYFKDPKSVPQYDINTLFIKICNTIFII